MDEMRSRLLPEIHNDLLGFAGVEEQVIVCVPSGQMPDLFHGGRLIVGGGLIVIRESYRMMSCRHVGHRLNDGGFEACWLPGPVSC